MTEDIGLTIIQAVGLILPVTILTAKFALDTMPDRQDNTIKQGKLLDVGTHLISKWLLIVVTLFSLSGAAAAVSLILTTDALLLRIALVMIGGGLLTFVPLIWAMRGFLGIPVIQ